MSLIECREGESLEDAARRVATDALYTARDNGGTMHDAGAAAGEAVSSLYAGAVARIAELEQTIVRASEKLESGRDVPRSADYNAGWNACVAHSVKVIERLEARLATTQGAVEERDRLRSAIEAHQSIEYADLPGDCDEDFLIALAESDAELYAALKRKKS